MSFYRNQLALGSIPQNPVGAVFSPSDIAGLIRWYNADSLGLANGATVSTWTDLAGVSNMVGTGIYATNKLNGHAGVTFNGTSGQRMVAAGVSNSFTAFLVAKQESTTTGRILTATYPGVNWLMGWHSTTQDDYYAEGWVYDGTTPVTTNPYLYAAKQTGAASTFYKRGVQLASNALGVTAPTSGICFSGYASAEWANCCVFETIFYNTALSDIDRANVEAYLIAKYNL